VAMATMLPLSIPFPSGKGESLTRMFHQAAG
jgi:hypothetical protein